MKSILIFLSVLGLVSSEIYFKKGSPHVNLTESAAVSGKLFYSRDGRPFNAFVGIPFGTIPQRFAESVPAPLWNGVKTSKPGHVCPQIQFGDGEGFLGDEDCLNLNVYVPLGNMGEEEGLPVMVWVHGGGFTFGNGVEYGPHFFMDEKVILVTFNYRLGIFGFLSTGDEVVPGNNGLKDQVLALKWVKKFIKNFGGNPNQVTLFGESAGAISVHLLLLSQTTDGLFHRAISQSSSGASFLSFQPNPKTEAVELATFLKCKRKADLPTEITSEEILNCFRNLPMGELITGHYSYKPAWPLNYAPFYFTPTAEPEPGPDSQNIPFLTKPAIKIMMGDLNSIRKVPWIIGVTEDEGSTLFSGVILKNKKLTEELDQNWEKIICPAIQLRKYLSSPVEEEIVARKIRKFYFGNEKVAFETRDNLTNLFSDSSFTYGVYRSALALAGRGQDNPVWLYQYAYQGPVSVFGQYYDLLEEEAKKVGHGDELAHQFVLGELSSPTDSLIKTDTEDEKFSRNFVKLWTSFALNGKPDHNWSADSSERWKPISKQEVYKEKPLTWFRIESKPGFRTDLYKERMEFWERIYEEHILTKAFLK